MSTQMGELTEAMIVAGLAAFNQTETLSVRRLLEVAYPAMCAADTRTGVREALVKCRDKFAEYVELHRAKLHDGTPTQEWLAINEKVERNQEMVDLCDQALSIPSSMREA